VKDVYLAASWNRRSEMRTYRRQLERYNIRVTSRWLDTDHLDSFDGNKGKVGAAVDLQDIMRCDTLILFTGGSTTGGMHVELGIAIGTGKDIVVIGKIENIFQLLPGNQFRNWSDFEEFLAKKRSEEVYPHGGRH
jgi:hypothetical protein